ncbi:MAG: thiamine pyrophosphate-binding protein [Solirubrobacterales bacterium]|jgi:acetolactate synthase-1/2/3 large subunit
MTGGDLIADVLQKQGVRFLFTLCGGHIAPILVSAKARGIRVVDVRHEVNAVFAADAVARLTGIPGVAAVTAGPGVTNTITAVKNAQMAQSPVVLLGGATATMLRGRGSLQDIDQMSLMKPHVKWATRVTRVRDLVDVLERAFAIAQQGVPGPVFVEVPVDLLYEPSLVRQWYGAKTGEASKGLRDAAVRWYVNRHLKQLFGGVEGVAASAASPPPPPEPEPGLVGQVGRLLARAERPVLLIGSQAMISAGEASALALAVVALGLPVYLSGMARGLLGPSHPLQLRHKRKEALREADLVILAGTPCDFRLDYGNHIRRSAVLVSINRSPADLTKNRRPTLGVLGAPERLLRTLAHARPDRPAAWTPWLASLRSRDDAREAEIAHQAEAPADTGVNPLAVCRAIERALPEDSVIVADGGDFVSTASYILRPRRPLSWLDPGVFGTLGVGAGFALGAKLVRPEAEVWIIYGDGSVGYSLSEADTFVRHGLPVIAVIGNDASWMQIAREQVEILKDDVGTVLRHSDYHRAAEGLGAAGVLLRDAREMAPTLGRAQQEARAGRPVYVNAILGKTDFRKGSISM